MTATMNGIVVTFDTGDPWPAASWPHGVFCTLAPKADSSDGYDDMKDLHSMYIIEGPSTPGDSYAFEGDFATKANGECKGEPVYVAMDMPTAGYGTICEGMDPKEFGPLVGITDEKECGAAAAAANQAYQPIVPEFFITKAECASYAAEIGFEFEAYADMGRSSDGESETLGGWCMQLQEVDKTLKFSAKPSCACSKSDDRCCIWGCGEACIEHDIYGEHWCPATGTYRGSTGECGMGEGGTTNDEDDCMNGVFACFWNEVDAAVQIINPAAPVYVKRFDGECDGQEQNVYRGCHYSKQQSLEHDDNPGSTPEENIRECAKACYARVAKAFEVIPSTGRCWCTNTDADTCTRIGADRHDGTCTNGDNSNGYERYDIVDAPRPAGCHTKASGGGAGTYFFNPSVEETRADWTNRLVCKSCNDPKDYESHAVPVSAPNEYFQFEVPDAIKSFQTPAVRFTHFVTYDAGHCSFAILVDGTPVYEFDYMQGYEDSSGTMTTTVNLPDNARQGTFTILFESGGKAWAGKGGQRAVDRPHKRQARHEVWGGTMHKSKQDMYGHVSERNDVSLLQACQPALAWGGDNGYRSI